MSETRERLGGTPTSAAKPPRHRHNEHTTGG